MKLERLQVSIGKHNLHRVVMRPDEAVPVKAVMMGYHGQGDYAERYVEIFDVFTRLGVLCVMTDLLGHGRSPGKRGDCGDEALLDAVIDSSLTEYVMTEDRSLPYGVMGHSMGGLLASRHVVLSGMGKLPPLSFAWISAPLVDPANGRTRGFVNMVKLLARLMPSVTISTKVKSADCYVLPEVISEPVVVSPPKNELWHSRVSLGWGAFLISFAEFLERNISSVTTDLPILVTQGSEDTVCPAEKTLKLVAKLPPESTRYLELEGVLHDPFTGKGSEVLFTELEAWLMRVLPKS